MDKAAEAVVRWLLARRGVGENDVVEFCSVLRRGIQAVEADSVALLERFLSEALAVSEGTRDETSVRRLVQLHGRSKEVASAMRVVGKLASIRTVLEQPGDARSATRAKARRIMEIVQDPK